MTSKPLAAYPEYKDSGESWLGDVPEHWQPLRFKYAFSEKKKTSNPSLPPGSISFGSVVPKDVDNLSPDTLASYQEVLCGEILVNPLNMNYDLISLRTALSEIDVVVSSGYLVLHSGDFLNKRYVRWLLHEFDVAHMKTLGAGVRQTVSFVDIGNCFFFQPTRAEQKSIADFLDYETTRIDTLIRKQQQLIELLKEKRQAVISHAVTKGLNSDAPMRDSGVEWLGEVPKHWDTKPLKALAELQPGKSGLRFGARDQCTFVPMEKLKLDSLITDEVALIRDVFGGYTYFCDGDVLLAKVTPCFENQNFAVAEGLENGVGFGSSEIYVLRANQKIVNRFLFYRLRETMFMDLAASQMTGAGGLKRVPGEFLRSFLIAVPPTEEQKQIVARLDSEVDSYEQLIGKADEAIGLMQERRSALISSAVTGKIDVRDWQPPECPGREAA